MAVVSFQTFTSTNIALLSIISLCILLDFIRGGQSPSQKHLSPTHQIEPLDISLTKVSQVWNTSYAGDRYKNGWSVPDNPGFIGYIQEKWLDKKSTINKDIPFGQTTMNSSLFLANLSMQTQFGSHTHCFLFSTYTVTHQVTSDVTTPYGIRECLFSIICMLFTWNRTMQAV